MTDEVTLAVYAAKAEVYADLTDKDNAKDPILKAFINALPAGGYVLDLGCGPGTSAQVMAKAGLTVDAWDPVAQMVELAAQHTGVSARRAGFHDLNATSEYDGIWANFSLLHAPRRDMPDHLGRIAQALKPGGRFHIGVKTGTGSKRDALGRLYTYYTQDELAGLMKDAGLTVCDYATGVGKGLDGADAAWVSLAAHA